MVQCISNKKTKCVIIFVWYNHGTHGAGSTLDEAFGLVETVEKSAEIYMMIGERKIINPITDDNLVALANSLNLDYRKDFID